MVLTKSFRVWRKYKPRSAILESKDVPEEALLFESGTVAVLSPLELEIISKECNHADSISAYGCLGVLCVDSDTDTFHYLVVITECQAIGKLNDSEIFRITQTAFIPLSNQAKMERVIEVGRLLASGKFYFSYPSYGEGFDILSCSQKQGKIQRQFHWNRSLYVYLERFGVACDRWLFKAMCGFVDIQTVYAGDKKTKMVLISRISCERAGTRLNVRGMNDDGHVANFVETELAIHIDQKVASFVIIRGLVPLFWEQPGIQTAGGLIKIKLRRGYACSHPSFERHFEWCLLHYGPLLVLNLLGDRNQEAMLSSAFQDHFSELSSAYCAEMVCYDYHKMIKSGGANVDTTLNHTLLPLVQSFTLAHSFYHAEGNQPTRLQTGTTRVNCLDCLDRTNSVQSFLCQTMLPQLLGALDLSTKSSVLARFQQLLTTSFTKNGDSLSLLYSGTRALTFEGKANKFKGGARSVQRAIQNNFMDTSKQEAIDMLLQSNSYSGNLGQKSQALLDQGDIFSPVPYRQAVCKRWSDFTTPEKLRVAIGTWNVNGGKLINSVALRGSQSLADWLLDGPKISGAARDHPEDFATPPDIYAIGFEELVGLTASNIVFSASSSNRREWGAEIQKVLSRDTPYELLTAEQLVGVCLYIFIKPKLIPYIRDVAVCTAKTGMSGNAGNKGGVAIRFLLHSTTLAFVCSHFAAHQNKVQERNHDFQEICRKISFPHGQTLDLHDYVFWCGDLNYRVDLPTTNAKDYIAQARWEKLTKQDQLIKQKRVKKVFQGYIEGELTFAPTYKYDEFSDDYDTSEKCRTPAWCDRVLWRRRGQQGGDPLPYPKQTLIDTHVDIGVDFGPHPSDAGLVVGGEFVPPLGLGDEHPWHPGRLLYYNRAELKQSDHRPVLGLIEVDMFRVDPAKRSAVCAEVLKALGPLDPTIVVQEAEPGDAEISVTRLLEAVKSFGVVILVRITDESILVTFKKPLAAVASLALDGTEVGGIRVKVCLREGYEATEHVQLRRRRGREQGGPAVSVLTSDVLGVESDHAQREDDLMSFSIGDEQQPTASSEGGATAMSDDDQLDVDSDTAEPELNLSSSSSDSESKPLHEMRPNISEPILSLPKPVPAKRPIIPPRPTQSSSNLAQVVAPVPKPRSRGASPEAPRRPSRPPPPTAKARNEVSPPTRGSPPPLYTPKIPDRPSIPKRPDTRPVRPPPPKKN